MSNDKAQLIHILVGSEAIRSKDQLKNSEIIQSALEYNTFLINKVIENRRNLTQAEYDAALQRLWSNLNTLTKSADFYLGKYPLVNKKNEEETSCVSTRRTKRAQQSIESKQFSNLTSGLVVDVNKNILKESNANN